MSMLLECNFPVSSIHGKCANQSCMTLPLVRCSIEADQGGTVSARVRVRLVSWEEGSHAVLFMVPLSHPGARSMAQALRLPFEHYYYQRFQLSAFACKDQQEHAYIFTRNKSPQSRSRPTGYPSSATI